MKYAHYNDLLRFNSIVNTERKRSDGRAAHFERLNGVSRREATDPLERAFDGCQETNPETALTSLVIDYGPG